MTTLDVITEALRELGVLAAGEVATSDDATNGLDALNNMVDQWAAERLNIYQQARTTFTIAASTQAYAVGSGQTVDIPRPIYIDHVNFSDSSADTVQELSLIELTFAAWAGIPQKDLTATYPTHFWYAPDFPAASLKLWPVPTSSTLTGIIYHPKQISEFASLSTTLSLPPGYRRMIVKNLALEMAPSYEKIVGPMLMAQAMDSMAVVKRSNHKVTDLSFDPGALVTGPSFDIAEG